MFKDFLVQCSHHDIDKWRLCQILYDGLNYQNRTLLETESREILESRWTRRMENIWRPSRKIIQWEPTPEESRNSKSISSRRGLHSMKDSMTTEAKFDKVMWKLEAIELRNPVSLNQVSLTLPAGCTYCQVINHMFEECPVFIAHQILPEHMMQHP